MKRSKGGSGDGHELGREGMNESTAPDQKLRATKKVYRDMKMFLGKYLDELAPPDQEDNTGLAPLLQQLWDTFFKEVRESVLIFNISSYSSSLLALSGP